YSKGDLLTINGFGAAPSRSIFIDILAPDGTEFDSLSIFSTGTGAFTTVWIIPKDIDSGTYTIKVDDADETAETTFTIQ
ncbi:MAG: biofilm-associated protein, partial [Nitrosopumilaceae archaeon]